MTGKTHALIGVAAVLFLHPALPTQPIQYGAALAVAALGALAPDVDSDESQIRQITKTNRKRGVHGWLVSALMPSHRGITHSALALLAVYLVASLYVPVWAYGLAFVIGYASHLLADGITTSGIPFLWPLSFRFIPYFRPVRTGGVLEQVVALGVVAALLWRFSPEVITTAMNVLGSVLK